MYYFIELPSQTIIIYRIPNCFLAQRGKIFLLPFPILPQWTEICKNMKLLFHILSFWEVLPIFPKKWHPYVVNTLEK